jgi:hypothetical protein
VLWLVLPLAAAIAYRRRLWASLPLWLTVATHATGIAAGFLVTAVNAEGYLLTSLDRLALQVAPVALLAALSAFGTADFEQAEQIHH